MQAYRPKKARKLVYAILGTPENMDGRRHKGIVERNERELMAQYRGNEYAIKR